VIEPADERGAAREPIVTSANAWFETMTAIARAILRTAHEMLLIG
jgi:hypothetical protein